MAANDFDLHDDFDLDLPKPEDEYEGKDVPNASRLYLNAAEAQKYIARGHRVYNGPHRGLFIDETEVESQTQRVVPFQFVHENEAWIKDFIENDPETGKKREYADTFTLKTSGAPIPLPEMYHVPNHGPNTLLYDDGVERVTGSDEAKEAAKQGIKPKKHWKDHDPNIKKPKTSSKHIVTTRNHALVLNGDRPIPANAQNVRISADRTAPIQAVFWNPNEGKTRVIYSKERFKINRDAHWAALREHLDYLPDLINNVTAGADNAAEMDDSHRVIALIVLTGFRHGEATDEGKFRPDGGRTGIGTNALQAQDVTLTEADEDKPASVRFSFSGKSDVLHDRTYTEGEGNGSSVVNIIREALKGKESTDRLFPQTNEDANLKKLRSFVPEGTKTTKELKLKDVRSYMGTMAARAELERYVKEVEDPRDKEAFPTPEKRKKAFERMRDSAGFAAGEVLNHKTRKMIKNDEGEVIETQWKPKKSEAIKSYIDPKEWEKYKPEDVILKLMKIVEDLQKAKGKYKGRTGGITPDWTMKLPGEERDIDDWAEARRRKAEERQWGIKPVGGQPMSKTWVGSLNDRGFSSPLIKQVLGSQMWFIQDGVDYVATLGSEVVTTVEKAKFAYNRPSVSYAPSGRNNHNTKRKSSGMQGERYRGDTIDDDEEDAY